MVIMIKQKCLSTFRCTCMKTQTYCNNVGAGKDGISPLGFFLRRHFNIVLHSIYVTHTLTIESPTVQMSMLVNGQNVYAFWNMKL